MAHVWIEVIAPEDRLERLRGAAEDACAAEMAVSELACGRVSLRLLAGEIVDQQALLDRLQDLLEDAGDWHIVLTPTAATMPKSEAEQEAEAEAEVTASREEVFETVARGARLSRDFVAFTALATVVAAAGLVMDDLAVIIGSMVIAPLLGPTLALAFATATGDRALLLTALRSGAAGFALCIGFSALLPLVVAVDPEQTQIALRTSVGLGAIALALASGAAAALSLTAGLPTALVGVMVSAALLPPAAVLGLMLTIPAPVAAAGAGLLLGVNVAAVTLAAILTFLAKGVRPRHWHQREGAAQSVRVTVAALAMALAVMAGLIALDLRLG